jgi:ribosome-associated toxin RatA of RatAB toxin-antitoxin module
MRIQSFDQTDELDAPVEDVFALFKDIARWPEWVSVLSEASPLSTGPLRVGFRLQMTPTDLGWPIKTKLIEYEENRVIAWGRRSRLAGLVHTFRFEPLGHDRCRLHHTEFSTGLLAIPAWVLREKIHAYDGRWSADFVSRFARRG